MSIVNASGTAIYFVNHSGSAQALFDQLRDEVKELVMEIGTIRLELNLPANSTVSDRDYHLLFKDLGDVAVYRMGHIDDKFYLFFKRDSDAARVHQQNASLAKRTFG